ncbi:MAG: SRPBCC family protein [Vulcanimicrobiaceae bacterium]
MDLHYSGTERIPVPRDKVWAFINDPKSVGSCLPDVTDYKAVDDRNVDATVKVAVGPVRGNFKFKIELQPSPDGNHVGMHITGGGFGSVVDLIAGADISSDGDVTVLDWKGDATMRGPVATVGGRALDAQANRVITQTFANVKSRLVGESAAQAPAG